MPHILTRMLALLISSAMISGCASTLTLPAYQTPPQADTMDASLTIQYLGVGGHLIEYRGEQLLTAPSFTNPHFLRTGPWMPLRPNTQKIDRYLPDVSRTSMILVGHAHYDHLLDVPHILLNHAVNAHIYGSNSMAHTLAAVIDKDRLHGLDQVMGDHQRAGPWIYSASQTFRIMPLKSGHAPHIMGITFMTGGYKKDLTKLPWHAFGWKEGQTLAFIIDALTADGEVAHRIFYQDAASEQPLGLVPELEDGRGIDIAIICPASFSQIKHYPESIVENTQAQYFILGHWEDFFGNRLDGQQKFVRLSNQTQFIERLENSMPKQSQWTLPSLFSTYYFDDQGTLITP